jgi:hypothetical protein
MLTSEEYLTLLRSAAQQSLGTTGDNAMAMVIEDKIAEVQAIPFWRPDGLFAVSRQTAQIDEKKAEVIEVPYEYLKLGNDTPEQMQETLEAELDYIEVTMSPLLISTSAVAAMAIEPFPIIQELKRILRSIVEPKIESSAHNLDEFWKNWQDALTQLTDRTTSGAIEVLSSMSPIPFTWDEATKWLPFIGDQLPRQVLDLSLPLQQIIRWLFNALNKFKLLVLNRLGIDLGKIVKDSVVSQVVDVLRKQIVHLVADRVWRIDELTQGVKAEMDLTSVRLGIAGQEMLSCKRCGAMENCLESVKETVGQISWVMFGLGKIAGAAGIVMKWAAAEPSPAGEIAIGAFVLLALTGIGVLGEDALRDTSADQGLYRGIGPLAIEALRNLQ